MNTIADQVISDTLASVEELATELVQFHEALESGRPPNLVLFAELEFRCIRLSKLLRTCFSVKGNTDE